MWQYKNCGVVKRPSMSSLVGYAKSEFDSCCCRSFGCNLKMLQLVEWTTDWNKAKTMHPHWYWRIARIWRRVLETRPEPCDSKSFYIVRSRGKFPGDQKNWIFVVPNDTKKKKSTSRAICIFICLHLCKNNWKVKMEKCPNNLQWDDSLKARSIEEITFFLNNGLTRQNKEK